MKKLTLKIDDLQVDSFETAQVRATGGTVHGAAAVSGESCRWSDCWTCGIWCPETTDPKATAPCQCPVYTEAPVC